MATNEQEVTPLPTRAERAVLSIHRATDTGSGTYPLRVLIGMLVVAGCMLQAEHPFDLIGIIAWAVVAMWLSTTPRRFVK